MNRDIFLQQFNISNEDFETSGLVWSDLVAIHKDHTERISDLKRVARDVAERLQEIEAVHSVRYRVKDPSHLLEKIYRKKKEGKTYTLSDYREKITDLVGVRAIHLYKEDWGKIHESVLEGWNQKEETKAYIRLGDSTEEYDTKGIRHEVHPAKYRSVHYIIETRPTRDTIYVELQVRTLFEEGWSEIDHDVRYPYNKDDPLLGAFLSTFNGLAGNANEMGSFVRFLSASISEKKIHDAEVTKKHAERIAELQQSVDEFSQKANLAEADKRALQDKIEKMTPTTTTSGGYVPSYLLDAARISGTTKDLIEAARAANAFLSVADKWKFPNTLAVSASNEWLAGGLGNLKAGTHSIPGTLNSTVNDVKTSVPGTLHSNSNVGAPSASGTLHKTSVDLKENKKKELTLPNNPDKDSKKGD